MKEILQALLEGKNSGRWHACACEMRQERNCGTISTEAVRSLILQVWAEVFHSHWSRLLPEPFQPVRVPKLPAILTGFGALTNVSGDTMRKVIDLTGQVFGRLTVLHRSGSFPNGQAGWTCICECGNIVQVCGGSLRSSGTKSCGCLRVDHLRQHGLSKHSSYQSWCSMLKRCLNPKAPEYKNYGGRGITVCDRWLDVKNFIEDMGERPAGLSIERKDVNKGYFKDNCVWADAKTQTRNRRSSKVVTFNGKTATLAEHCEDSGLKYDTVFNRMQVLGWSLEKALTTPVRIPSEYMITSKP